MQNDALKLRLTSLKKASIELKSKVLNDTRLNYDSVSDIISSILPHKDIDTPILHGSQHRDSPEASANRSKNNSHGNRKESTVSNYSPTNSIFLAPPQQSNFSAPSPLNNSKQPI
jgi:hypothetical protein